MLIIIYLSKKALIVINFIYLQSHYQFKLFTKIFMTKKIPHFEYVPFVDITLIDS